MFTNDISYLFGVLGGDASSFCEATNCAATTNAKSVKIQRQPSQTSTVDEPIPTAAWANSLRTTFLHRLFSYADTTASLVRARGWLFLNLVSTTISAT